jgi:ADP-ribose pyrophosphatase YjhB (NUDIX family)
MKKNAKFHVGVKALVMNDEGKILLIRSGKKKPKVLKQDFVFWDFPGGKIRAEEDIQKALVREVDEEIHTNIVPIGLFDVAVSNFRDVNDKNLFLMLVVYRAKLAKESKFKLSWEHSAWEWVDINEAKKRLLLKYPQSFVDGLNRLKK